MSKDTKDTGVACDSYCAIEVKRPHAEGCCSKCMVGCKRFHWYLLSCIANAFLAPIVLTYHACRIYFLPCIMTYLGRCLGRFCRLICCDCIFRYVDTSFPPNSDSLGQTEKSFAKGIRDVSCCCPSPYETGGDVKWVRANDLFQGKKGKLFSGGITPSDIAQGQLGNCWLLAAIATLAEQPGVVESCFSTHDYSLRGKYELSLFDPIEEKRKRVVVDDNFPCTQDNSPLFTSPNGEEVWVLLLEKAFAKFMGDYAALEGGLPAWAMYVMTGDQTLHWSVGQDGTWTASSLEGKMDKGKMRPAYYGTGEKINGDRLFTLITEYCAGHCALGAGTKGKDETISQGRGTDGGIVPGHAYSILDCRKIFEFRLIKLRNPWGTFEWKGAWSRDSELWDQHPMVKATLRESAAEEEAEGSGTFWMAWDDFVKFYDMVDVTVLTQGLGQLSYDAKEDMECCFGCCGPCVGCLQGCAEFWCLCKGCCKLYCDRKSTKVFAMSEVGAGEKLSKAEKGVGAGNGSASIIPDEFAINPFAPSERSFCMKMLELAELEGGVDRSKWLEAAWQNGCDPEEMPRAAQLFDRLAEKGCESPRIHGVDLKQNFAWSVCEV